MSIFEAERLLRAYRDRQQNEPRAQEKTASGGSGKSQRKLRKEKALGWIPNPHTPMNQFYNNVYESFFMENICFFGDSTKRFAQAFHSEARRQYTIHQAVEKVREKLNQLMNAKDPSGAGYLLREEHILRPHDSSIARMNLERIQTIEATIKTLEHAVKGDLDSTIHVSGRVKTGRKTAHDFDEGILSDLQLLKASLRETKSKLTELKEKVASVFKVDYAGAKRRSRSKKQNRHRAAVRKLKLSKVRKLEVLKKIAPELEEGILCEIHDLNAEKMSNLGKRERKWAWQLADSNCSLLSSTGKRYLREILAQGQDAQASAESEADEGDDEGDGDECDDEDDAEQESATGMAINYQRAQSSSSDEDFSCNTYYEHLSEPESEY